MPTLWPHVPTRFSEALEFSTDVQSTRDAEFRTQNKDATQRITLGHHFEDDEAARADGLYRSQATGDWFVPLWAYSSRLTGTLTAGQTVIPGVITDADYRSGGKACVILDDRQAEVVDVVSAADGILTISAPGLVGTYVGAGSMPIIVAPCLEAIAPGGNQRDDRVAIAQTALEFIVTDPADLGASLYPAHRTFDVVTDSQVVMGSLSGGIAQAVDLFDSGFGAYAIEEEETYVRARRTFAQVVETPAELWGLIRWLHLCGGRDRAFWLPSWKNDLPLQATIGAGAVTFRTQAISPVVSDLVGRSIQIDTPSGTLIHREITGAAEVSGTNDVDLTIAAPGIAVSPASTVSLMELVRFDSDVFEVQHQVTADPDKPFVSRFTAPVIEVPA